MKKHIVTGLVILLPLALTITILHFLIHFLTNPFLEIVTSLLSKTSFGERGFLFLSPEQVMRYTSQGIILICLFLGILLLGMLARWCIVRWLIQWGDNILHRLPIVNKIYRAVKDIVVNIFGHGTSSFHQVVMVPFPGEGIFALGFLSQRAPRVCSEKEGAELISVFVPTAPNPTTGFTIMYRTEEIQYISMRPEEAIKYIVSCGIVTPTDHHGTTPEAAS
jgi:uncharacterized membrane protein